MAHHVSSLKLYFSIFFALLVGTGLTVAVAYMDLGAMNTVVALLIACVKATLVVLFFMHVKYSSGLTKLFVVSGFAWLFILVGLTMGDYVSRHWQHKALGWVPGEQRIATPFHHPAATGETAPAPAHH